MYNVHEYFFDRDSPVITAQLSRRRKEKELSGGGLVVLEGVKAIDFDEFLSIFT